MPTALVTGASAGLGTEFAKLFAADGHDVVLVARRKDRLDALGQELSDRYKVKAYSIAADLMDPSAPSAIVAEVERLGLSVEFLVNNAGFGTSGPFYELDAAKEIGEVQCNVTALVALTRAFVPAMVARKQGRVLNVGSTAGFQPGPRMATYYATKAFVNSFSMAVGHELSGTGVTMTVSCPGPTATDFFSSGGVTEPFLARLGMMNGVSVARSAYRAMHAGRSRVVHGWRNKLLQLFALLTPAFILVPLVGWVNRSPSTER